MTDTNQNMTIQNKTQPAQNESQTKLRQRGVKNTSIQGFLSTMCDINTLKQVFFLIFNAKTE